MPLLHLKYNYRSHKGILALASSVLDLLKEFFPKSFDQLERDQGMFDGPQPAIIESSSPGKIFDTNIVILLFINMGNNSELKKTIFTSI